LLVLQRVGHRDGSPVDQRDFASLPEPLVAGARFDPLSGLMHQVDDDSQREPLPSVAVAVGLRRARLAAVDRQPDDQPRDCGATRMVGVEDLGEEQAEGHQRGADSLIEADAFGGQRRVDHLDVEEFVKGEDIGFVERLDLLRNPPSCSLGHCRPPCRTGLGSCGHPSLSQGGRHLSIPSCTSDLRNSECHSSLKMSICVCQ